MNLVSALSILSLVWAMDGPSFKAEPGIYGVKSQWGHLCVDPFGGSLVHCNPGETPAIFRYKCSGHDGHCILSVAGKEVSIDPMAKYYANHVKLVEKAIPSVVLVPRRLAPNGDQIFLVQFSKSKIMGGDTYMDATNRKGRTIEYNIREDSPSQEFVFRKGSMFGIPTDPPKLDNNAQPLKQRAALKQPCPEMALPASSLFGPLNPAISKPAPSFFGAPIQTPPLKSSVTTIATPEKESVKPGEYFIRSQFGFICSTKTGTVGHCSSLGVKAHSWNLYKFQNGSALRSSDGYIQYGLDPVDKTHKPLVRSDPSKITLTPGTAPLNGDTTFQIQVFGADKSCLLKAEGNHQLSVVGWVGPSGLLNDFVLVPAYKESGRKISFLELTSKSQLFEKSIGTRLPLEANKIGTLHRVYGIDPEVFQRQAENVQIVLDASTYELFTKFFAYKKANGNAVERAVYAGLADTNAFIDRLLKQRPLTFFTKDDVTRLRHSPVPIEMSLEWSLVGQVDAQGRSIEGVIKMSDYLTHEEMELSALISVSTPTHFINNGERHNRGQYGPAGLYPMQGVLIAAAGPRFEIPARMEFRQMALMHNQQPSGMLPADPVSRMWQEYYNIKTAPLASEYEGSNVKLHIPTYKARLAKSILPILLHGNRLARRSNRHATIRLVGFGLGAWAVPGVNQQTHFHQTVEQLIRNNSLESTFKIEMLWMGRPGEQYFVNDKSGNRVLLTFHNGNPADPVGPGELLIATYAWDGNSFPGNEYWIGALDKSGDPAAAACSTIQELQNPFINTCLSATNNLSLYS